MFRAREGYGDGRTPERFAAVGMGPVVVDA
jgi:hypothetical protein